MTTEYRSTMSLLDEMPDTADIIAFKPERAGESVEGVVVALDITSSEYTSDDIPVITLKDDAGVFRGVRAYHTVLRNELAKHDVAKGDRIAIKYKGKVPTKNGKGSYHSYVIAVEKDDPGF